MFSIMFIILGKTMEWDLNNPTPLLVELTM